MNNEMKYIHTYIYIYIYIYIVLSMRYKHMAYRTWNEVGAHVSQEIVTSGGSRPMLFGQ
jgi:hypothetical protein